MGGKVKINLQKVASHRPDFGLKCEYGRQFLRYSSTSRYIKSLYWAHLRIWNSFLEDNKNCKEDFASSYERLLTDCFRSKETKTDLELPPILIGENMQLQNGIHRLSAKVLTGITLKVNLCNAKASYNQDYFQKFVNHNGNSSSFSEQLLNEMSRLTSDFITNNILFVLPRSTDIDNGNKAKHIISSTLDVSFYRRFTLSKKQLKLLVAHFYYGENWAFNDSGFDWDALNNKASMIAAPDNNQVIDCYFTTSKIEDINAAKTEIRSRYRLSKHSIHTSNRPAEALHAFRFLCSSENAFEVWSQKSEQSNFVFKLAQSLRSPNYIYNRDCVVTGSSISDIAGHRIAADTDYLTRHKNMNGKIDSSHNQYDFLYPEDPGELIDNPKHHFYLFGQKILSKNTYIYFKKLRNETKDIADISRFD